MWCNCRFRLSEQPCIRSPVETKYSKSTRKQAPSVILQDERWWTYLWQIWWRVMGKWICTCNNRLWLFFTSKLTTDYVFTHTHVHISCSFWRNDTSVHFRRVPPVNVRILYALGITTLFPNLKDPDSTNGYVSSPTVMHPHTFIAFWMKKFVSCFPSSAVKCIILLLCCRVFNSTPWTPQLIPLLGLKLNLDWGLHRSVPEVTPQPTD